MVFLCKNTVKCKNYIKIYVINFTVSRQKGPAIFFRVYGIHHSIRKSDEHTSYDILSSLCFE